MPLIEDGHPQVYAPMVWRSFAKINLYLDVLRKRRDGYHNIETIFQTVSLYDELTFINDDSLSLSCNGPGLDMGPSNLVYRAAALLREETGCRKGVRIHLDKRIPIAAGLAGGSGNAAATLAALNNLWNLRLSFGHLARLARGLGADVAYCLYGGTMAGTQRGEALVPLPPVHEPWFILVHPAAAMSTASAYNHVLLKMSPEFPFAERTPSFRKAIIALAEGDFPRVLFNRMEKPVFSEHQALGELKERLYKAGCGAVAMSGSGPTLFGVCRSRQEALRIAEVFHAEKPECPTSVVNPSPKGIEWVR